MQKKIRKNGKHTILLSRFNPLNPELNPICYLLALLGAHHFLHVSRIRVKRVLLQLAIFHCIEISEHVVWRCSVVLPSEQRTSSSSFIDNCRGEPFSCNSWLVECIIPRCMYLVIGCLRQSVRHRLQRVLFIRQSIVFGHSMTSASMAINIISSFIIVNLELN